jgi:hypothetical protein
VLLDWAQHQPITPETLWRYAWLQHRQIMLMPAVIGDPLVNLLCLEHARAIRAIANDARANPEPHRPEHGLLLPLAAASLGVWSALSARIQEAPQLPSAWSDRDAYETIWLNFCLLALLGSREPDGRPRSRRELSDLLARIQRPKRSSSTIRLNLLPRIEQYFEVADQWAALMTLNGNSRLRKQPGTDHPAGG